MLRKRSGAVGSKKVLMADHHILSPTARCSKTASSSSLFPSPRLLIRSFSGKALQEPDAAMSPTSILEAKNFSSSGLSLLSEKNFKSASSSSETCHLREGDSGRGIGLGIVDALSDEKSRRVLLGSQLRIQIPGMAVSSSSCSEFSSSPIEFGIKTKDSLLSSLSPSLKSAMSSGNLAPDPSPCSSSSPPRIISGALSTNGMELSEDYTCVITRGPNARTIHIFEDYIVESSGEELLVRAKEEEEHLPASCMTVFLSFCHSCKKGLRQGNDTFMYRGERAFCSEECRNEGMMSEGGEP